MLRVQWLLILCIIVNINCKKFEGFIVGGKLAPIDEHPYSVYLSMSCSTDDAWMCGGSILNQDIILTAAHCLRSCPRGKTLHKIGINIGSTHKNRGKQKIKAQAFVVHEDYDAQTDAHDIGLIRTNHRMIFGSTVNRVAIMEHPPKFKRAQVAGWGLTDELNRVSSVDLQTLSQVLWSKRSCENIYGHLPEGSFCAASQNPNTYVAAGDSGSALVINDYIQIGLVSYKIPSLSKTLIVYSNVSYYFDWITYNSRRLFCDFKKFILRGNHALPCGISDL